MEIAFSQHIHFPSLSNACDQAQLSRFSCILSKILMFNCFFHVLSPLLSSRLFYLICFTVDKNGTLFDK